MKISFRHDDEVLAFLREEIGLDLAGQNLDNADRWLFVVARNDHGAVVGALVMEAKNWFDWHLSIAVIDHRCLLISRLHKLVWRTIFERAVRVTILIDPDNETLERRVRKMGFVYEGFLRKGLDGHRDALVFGMLQEDCRWLRARPEPSSGPPRVDFGQTSPTMVH
jgi:RimJ/RimL family protein N-acetyltransferase